MRGDQYEMWKADGNIFNTLMALANGMRGVKITGGDIGKMNTIIPRNTNCIIVVKLYDPRNGVGTGCLNFTLINALLQDTSPSGPENKFITDTLNFMAYSPDGNTDPLTITETP